MAAPPCFRRTEANRRRILDRGPAVESSSRDRPRSSRCVQRRPPRGRRLSTGRGPEQSARSRPRDQPTVSCKPVGVRAVARNPRPGQAQDAGSRPRPSDARSEDTAQPHPRARAGSSTKAVPEVLVVGLIGQAASSITVVRCDPYALSGEDPREGALRSEDCSSRPLLRRAGEPGPYAGSP